MKILKLPVYSYPERAASGYLGQNLNDAFVEEGWTVVSYVPTPSRGVSKEVREEYKKKEHRREVSCDGKKIVRRFSLFSDSPPRRRNRDRRTGRINLSRARSDRLLFRA